MKYRRDVLRAVLGNTFLGVGNRVKLLYVGCSICLAASLAACSNQEMEQDAAAPIIQGGLAQTGSVKFQNYIYPSSLKMSTGKDSSQPISVLSVKDESGTADDWNNYLEFTTVSSGLQGTFTFTVPSSVNPAQLSGLTLLSNYKGQSKSFQTWSFQIYNVISSQWVAVGDNTSAQGWVWSEMDFPLTGATQNFINSSGQLSLRILTSSNVDNCDLDFLALGFNTSGTTSSPSPPPSPPPSPQPSGSWWIPAPGTSWQVQFAGTLDTSVKAQAFDLDLFDTPATTIAQLHSAGAKVICYFSAGTLENWRPDYKSFPSSVIGSSDSGWSGENWLDVRQTSILIPLMGARMDLAVQKGCDALDLDNMDGYTNSTGFPLAAAEQLTYNTDLANEAHKRGLSISLKNDLDQVNDLVNFFDFAINESCQQYNECNLEQPFITHNKAVFEIEYTGTASSICAAASTLHFDTILKHTNLDSYLVACP